MTAMKDIREKAVGAMSIDPVMLAQELCGSLSRNERAAWLIELTADAIRSAQRQSAHRVEMTAFSQSRTAGEDELRARMRDLFSTPIALGENESALWGSATVEQHRQRIAMLSKIRDGIDSTIRRHTQAIEIIEDAGVTCLNEVGDRAVVSALIRDLDPVAA